ncbi:response regulator transcription factor [Solibacillus sp. FSL H8-0538]|uniref:response regulator transcription factor n=1 Tax=Solibacillus sp. FSL H8-0538 TaxID=2921400 RepID=UPI0030FA99FB
MYKLLIADDEYEIRNGLSSYFPWESIGFEVVGQAADGVEILTFIEQQPVDVLLTDIRMPVMTGIQVAQHLFEHQANIKVVFLSGFQDFHYAQQAIAYGVNNYITKPTKYSELSDVFCKIKQLLDANQKPYLLPQLESSNDKIIDTIKKYVQSHYQNASLEGAAKLVHMNPYYISKYFKEKTGTNFSDYVVQVKMKKAAELLDDVQYKIYEISEMVGYSNSKNFTRTFRKTFGKSPREYRQEE